MYGLGLFLFVELEVAATGINYLLLCNI
jgi:hypothetical protein